MLAKRWRNFIPKDTPLQHDLKRQMTPEGLTGLKAKLPSGAADWQPVALSRLGPHGVMENFRADASLFAQKNIRGQMKVVMGEAGGTGARIMTVEGGTLGGEMVQLRPVKRKAAGASKAEKRARLAEKNSRGLRGRIYRAEHLAKMTHPHWAPVKSLHSRNQLPAAYHIRSIPGELPRVVADCPD